MKRKIFTIVALLAGIAAIQLIGPQQLGGPLSYVVTSGSSMEPGLSDGDLVLVKEASSYEPGDVVAYMNEELGSPVLHRIVRKEGNRYVLQGDNNDFLDGYEPTVTELLGRRWVVIPSGGKLLKSLTAPPVAAAIAVILGLSVSGSLMVRRRRRSPGMPPPTNGMPMGIVPPTGIYRGVAAGLAVAFALVAALGAASFTRPVSTATERSADLSHSGRFTYSGETAIKTAVYDRGRLTTGDPIYTSLVDQVAIRFDYALNGDAEDVAGHLELGLRISTADGWKRTVEMTQESFEGTTGSVEGVINVDRLRRMTSAVEAATGFDPGLYNVDVVVRTSIDGSASGERFDSVFAPVLSFTLDGSKLQLVQANIDASEASSLNPTEQLNVKVIEDEPTQLTLLGRSVAVEDARRVVVVGAALLALIAGLAAAGYVRALRNSSEAEKLIARYPDRFAAIRSLDALADLPEIEMSSIEDLVRLADANESLLLYVPTETIDRFVLPRQGVTYVYRLNVGSTHRPLAEEVREILLDESSVMSTEPAWAERTDVG